MKMCGFPSFEGCSLSLFHSSLRLLNLPEDNTLPHPGFLWMMNFWIVLRIILQSNIFHFSLPLHTHTVHQSRFSLCLNLSHGYIIGCNLDAGIAEIFEQYHWWKCEMMAAFLSFQNPPWCRICPANKTKLFTSPAESLFWIQRIIYRNILLIISGSHLNTPVHTFSCPNHVLLQHTCFLNYLETVKI